jgi:acyl carrier protein
MVLGALFGLLDSVIQEIGAQDRREHERRMQQLHMIENSSLRDEYVKQLLIDRILCPVESAHHDIQNTAKHAQWLSEIILFHYRDHNLTEEQAYALSKELKLLAIQITQVDSLHDLKFVYAVITLFNDKIVKFRHHIQEYSIQYNIRHHILNKLNTCIATANNFRVREELMRNFTGQAVLPGFTVTYQPNQDQERERKDRIIDQKRSEKPMPQLVDQKEPKKPMAQLVDHKEPKKPTVKPEVNQLRGKFGGDEEKTEIFIKVRNIVMEKVGIEHENQITLDSHLGDHLGADEFDMIQVIQGLENEFKIKISDEEQEDLMFILNWKDIGFWVSSGSGIPSSPAGKCTVRDLVELVAKKRQLDP